MCEEEVTSAAFVCFYMLSEQRLQLFACPCTLSVNFFLVLVDLHGLIMVLNICRYFVLLRKVMHNYQCTISLAV